MSDFGRLDGMCNIAGAMFPGLIEDLDDDMIDRGIDAEPQGRALRHAVRDARR